MVSPSTAACEQLSHKYDFSRLTEQVHQGLKVAETRSAQWQSRLNLLGVLLTVEVACNPQISKTDVRPLNVPVSPELSHADPISSLRQQDVQAMQSLFDREDIRDIEENIQRRLETLCPEPCWDEEPYEFLRDYL
ncbi:MAG: hypothetical protein VKK04_17885 [Synechococcales bacterium]|nr:hypothetical protein [Synechococcales bacterium]